MEMISSVLTRWVWANLSKNYPSIKKHLSVTTQAWIEDTMVNQTDVSELGILSKPNRNVSCSCRTDIQCVWGGDDKKMDIMIPDSDSFEEKLKMW